MKNKKKLLVVLACLALCVCTVVTGTLAWLTAKTNTVINTFSPSNIKLELDVTDPETYQMIPSEAHDKQATVTVTADIASYVFIMIEETNNAGDYLAYSVDTTDGAWKQVTDQPNVWYRAVNPTDADGEDFPVLTGGKVTVKDSVTNAMMNDLISANVKPTLTFTAYAIQQLGFAEAAAAWNAAKNLT